MKCAIQINLNWTEVINNKLQIALWADTVNIKCQWEPLGKIWEQQWQQRLQVDLGFQSDTTSPGRHLGCHPSWVWEHTGANMAVYPPSITHLPQGLSASQRICSNSSNPLNMAAVPYSSTVWQHLRANTWKLCPTPAFNQIQSSNMWHCKERINITVECTTGVPMPYVKHSI